jgi:hypothetical protein
MTDRHALVATIAQVVAEVDNLTAAITEIVALHHPDWGGHCLHLCLGCGHPSPCPTIDILTGRGLA